MAGRLAPASGSQGLAMLSPSPPAVRQWACATRGLIVRTPLDALGAWRKGTADAHAGPGAHSEGARMVARMDEVFHVD